MNLALPSTMVSIGSTIKGAFSGIFVKVLTGLVIASCVVAYVFYHNYQNSQKTLDETKTTLSRIDSELTTVKGQYNNLKQQFDLLKASNDITDNTRTNIQDEKTTYTGTLSAIERQVEDKVSAIKKRYATMEQTELNQAAKEREISSERIKGLWATFCLTNADHSNCKP